jgi:hypothetical protein
LQNPNNDEIGVSIRYYLYQALLKDTSRQFTDWFRNTRSIIKDSQDHRTKYLYYINRKFRHDLIDKAEILHKQHTKAASIIIGHYRLWKISIIERKIKELQQILEISYNRVLY